MSHLDVDRRIIKLSLQDSLGPNDIRAGLTISSNETLEEIDARPSIQFLSPYISLTATNYRYRLQSSTRGTEPPIETKRSSLTL